jgi:hypothetical protein
MCIYNKDKKKIKKINGRITDVNSATGTAYPSREPNIIATFRVAQYLVFV